jgi:hypothetical protein
MSRSITQKSQNELKTEPQAAKKGLLSKHSATKELIINLDHKEGLKSQPSKQLTKRIKKGIGIFLR